MVFYQFVARTGTEGAFHCLPTVVTPHAESELSHLEARRNGAWMRSVRMTLGCGDKEDL
jgi:hypothetical protein